MAARLLLFAARVFIGGIGPETGNFAIVLSNAQWPPANLRQLQDGGAGGGALGHQSRPR